MNQRCAPILATLLALSFSNVIGQTADASLSSYQLTEGNSTKMDLTISLRSGQVSWLEVESPFLMESVILESLKKNGSMDIAVTRDSALFSRKIANTALLRLRGNRMTIQFTNALKSGDRAVLALVVGVPSENSVSGRGAEKPFKISVAEKSTSSRIPLKLPKSMTLAKRIKP